MKLKLNPLKKQKTLGSILGTFTKTLADLDALVEKNKVESGSKYQQAVKLMSHAEALNAESSQASAVAGRIRDLISFGPSPDPVVETTDKESF